MFARIPEYLTELKPSIYSLDQYSSIIPLSHTVWFHEELGPAALFTMLFDFFLLPTVLTHLHQPLASSSYDTWASSSALLPPPHNT
jgi:hypothetical protein